MCKQCVKAVVAPVMAGRRDAWSKGSVAVGTDNDVRISQMRKGAVELAALGLFGGGELYGVQIVERLSALPGLAVTAGTVYPLLSRLKRAGLLDSVWRESPAGPPRKYYRLTRAGHEELVEMAGVWRAMVSAVETLLPEVTLGD